MSDKVEIEKAAGIERWWSLSARNHSVMIDVGGKSTVAKFKNFSLSLDLSKDGDKAVSAGLRAHPQAGISFYQVGSALPDDASGKTRRVAMLKMLRKIITDNTNDSRVRVVALEQVRALFTNAEMAKAGMDVVTEDADALLDLALKTKSLKGLE
jgi:hypothetical protein